MICRYCQRTLEDTDAKPLVTCKSCGVSYRVIRNGEVGLIVKPLNAPDIGAWNRYERGQLKLGQLDGRSRHE